MSSEEELAARVDEDEKAAKAAAESAGQWFGPGPGAGEWAVRNNTAIIDCPTGVIAFDEGCPTDAQAAHIARHDPARALRYVEAVRAIVAESEGEGHGWAEHEPSYYAGLDFAVQRLAEVYDAS